MKFKSEGWKNRFLRSLCSRFPAPILKRRQRGRVDRGPATHAWALVRLSDRLPAAERDKRLALLARPSSRQDRGRPGDRVFQMGEVAERWYELGEMEQARALFAEALQIARQMTEKTEFRRGGFAARLAEGRLAGRAGDCEDFAGSRSQGRILGGIAFRLIDQNPAEAERVGTADKRKVSPGTSGPDPLLEDGRGRPGRARRAVEGLGTTQFSPHDYCFLALGTKVRDEPFSRECFQIAVRGIDQLSQDSPERYQHFAGMLLPIVERIDPALVPEVFWLDVASRLPVGNPAHAL